jgi:hypothetical protein
MQWSKLRKHIEELFADSLKGRVRLHETGYHGMHDEEGRNWITVDGQEIVNMPHWYGWTLRDYVDRPDLPEKFANYVSLFAEGGLRHAMILYQEMSIRDVVQSQNVLVQAIGMLDRRVGKRRLRALELKDAHPLVQLFHRLRCEAEGIPVASPQEMIAAVDLRHPAWPDARVKEE